jgi:hypothetical protein
MEHINAARTADDRITMWRETMSLARFEAQAAKSAIADNDPSRARNHALWAARHAHKAEAIYQTI